MRLRPKKSAAQNALRLLPKLADQFFRAGDESVEDHVKGEEVHAFRILTKRFRYTLEYFRPCYGAAMDVYLEMVRDLQRVLGDLNDCCSSRALVKEVTQAGEPPVRHKKLFGALARREEDLLDQFRNHWRNVFDSPGKRDKMLRYLSHPPRAKRAEGQSADPAARQAVVAPRSGGAQS